MAKKKSLVSDSYGNILRDIVAEVKMTRVVVANRVNISVMQLYWNIGRRLAIEKLERGYGSRVVDRLSADLKSEFPDETGFSSRNLWDMKRFYEFYHDADEKLRRSVAVSSESQILRRSVAESSNAVQSQESVSPDYPRPPHYVVVIPWRHNLLIMSKIKDVEEALYYAESAAIMGWTRDILLNFIKADTYHTAKVLPNQHNFDRTLPEHLQEQTNEMLKATLNLGFLGIKQPFKERELEKRIVEKIRLFMLELGEGFTFIGNQHHLTLGKKDYYVDLLFFNRKIRSLVAIDLKIGEFQPEYAGKMNHYLGLLDDQMRMPDENPSIGIIFCAEKDNIEVEVSLRDINKPIGVAEYRLLFPEDEIKAMIKRELKNSARSTTKH